MKTKSSDLPNPPIPPTETLAKLNETFRAWTGEIPRHQVELERVTADVAKRKREADPSNEQQLREISWLQTKVDVIPHAIERIRERLEEKLKPEIIKEADQFESALATGLRACGERRRDVIAAEIAHLFPGEVHDRAEQKAYPLAWIVAGESPLVKRLFVLADEVDASQHEPAAQRAAWMEELPLAIEALLEKAERARKL